jgi:uncharacterized membrane protein
MSDAHPNARLEAFSDGVFAIAMTLLIIDIKLPSPESIATADDLWKALGHLAPRAFAFLWSFVIILITWVNHHEALKLLNKSSAGFVYANGFMLLCVVFLPFPTSLMGEFLGTSGAAPAVVLYVSVMVAQAIAWMVLGHVALHDGLAKSERAAAKVRSNTTNGYYGLALYAVCAVLAIWFPSAVALVTVVSWMVWLIVGIRIRPDEGH